MSRDALLALLFAENARAPLVATLDARMLIVTATLGVVTGVLSGILPARLTWRIDLHGGLRQVGARTTDAATGPAGFALPAAQVSLTVVLLFGAALFARSLMSLRAVDPGFDESQVLAVRLDAQSLPYSQSTFASLYRALLERSSALPGVRRAALADQALFTRAVRQRNVSVDAFTPRAGADLNPYVLAVSPGFFDTMGMPLAAGRTFDDTDLRSGTDGVAVVNRSFARYYFGGADAIGRRFGFGGHGAARDVTIVGVVEDSKYSDLREQAPHLVYTPLGPTTFPTRSFSVSETTLTLRTDGDPAATTPAVQRLLAEIDPALAVIGVATLQQQVDRSLGQDRLVSTLASLFAALALMLTATGVYGVLSYRVSRQVREIGVRLALGARPAQVRWMIARRGLLVLTAGLCVGIPAALASARLVANLLFEMSASDWPSLCVAIGGVTLATVLALAGPARMAGRIDPLDALRSE
jgi:predicted permease